LIYSCLWTSLHLHQTNYGDHNDIAERFMAYERNIGDDLHEACAEMIDDIAAQQE